MRRGKLMDNMSKGMMSRTALVVLLVIIVTLAVNIQPAKAGPRTIIATYGEGYLEYVNGLYILHVKGSPYDMGYQNGFLLKGYVQALIQYGIQTMIGMGYSYEYLANCTQAMEPHIPQEYIEEMEGLADGSSMNYTDVLIYHTHGDVKYYGPGWTGCSGFVLFGNATMDGHLYHGRSMDLHLVTDNPVGLITVYEPENGIAFVNVATPGYIGVHTGMNTEGITLENNMSSSNNKTLDGMPIGFILRKVLQYANNLTQAIDIICQADRTDGFNILLGDGKNLNAAVVEISDSYCKVFWAGDPAEDVEPHYSIPNAVRRTNHYVDPELAATQRSPYDPTTVAWNWTWNRYEKLSQLIEDNCGNIDAQMSIEFLRTPPVAWAAINFMSVVFDSTDLELWVANSAYGIPAYQREFRYLSYDDLFPGYPVYLTVSSNAGGNVTTPGQGTFSYDEGTIVNLVAQPEAGYRFVNWTGNVSTIANINAASTNITMNGDYSITANFVKQRYDLTIASTAGGSVTTPGEGTFTYDGGTVINLVATPSLGYRFVNWTGDVGTIANANAATTAITMTGNYSITANFAPGYTPMVAAGELHTVGLKADGTVVATGWNDWGQCNVGNWTNISQVAAGYVHTVGLKADGTVIAVGSWLNGQCNVGNWTDIVQVTAGNGNTLGLKSDGTVVAVGWNDFGQCNVTAWTNITQVAAGFGHTVGVKSDGTVVAAGWNDSGQCNVTAWTNITQVAAGRIHTVGLKSDGTVVAVGYNYSGQCDVGGWTDITQVAAGEHHTVGLKSDTTLVTVGWNGHGQRNVEGWTDIIQVAAGLFHTVGLKSDGTVVAVGDTDPGQCNVGS